MDGVASSSLSWIDVACTLRRQAYPAAKLPQKTKDFVGPQAGQTPSLTVRSSIVGVSVGRTVPELDAMIMRQTQLETP